MPLELCVLAHVGRDHALDLLLLEQEAEAEVVDAGVVADHGEAADFGGEEAGDEVLGDAAEAKTCSESYHFRDSTFKIETFGLYLQRAALLRLARP